MGEEEEERDEYRDMTIAATVNFCDTSGVTDEMQPNASRDLGIKYVGTTRRYLS